MKTGYKSTLSLVKKGLTVNAPQLIGADLGTRGGEFWNFGGANGFDLKFSYTGHSSSVKAFEKCAPLNAIIGGKARAFVNGKTWIINKKGKAKNKEAMGEIPAKIRALITKPNPFQSQKEFEAQQYIYAQLFGFCFMLPIKPVGFENYDATRLWNIPPSMVDMEESQNSWLAAQKQSDVIRYIYIVFEGQRVAIPADDVWIMKDFTPSFKSPIFPESRVCSHEMQINNIIGAYESRNVLINYRGALGIISSEGKDAAGFNPIKQHEKEELQQDFRRYGLTRQQWQFIITSAAVKWTQMGVATKDLMLFEEIEDDVERLCDGWGYYKELLSFSKGATFSNKKEAKTLLYQDTIIPESESICEQWNNFFGLNDMDFYLVKDYSHVAALQQDQQKMAQARETRNKALQIEFLNNLITLDDWRVFNDMDPLGGDYGSKFYYELIAMGWKFGSAGAIPSKDPNATETTTIESNDTVQQ